jgi:hypothetical protein
MTRHFTISTFAPLLLAAIALGACSSDDSNSTSSGTGQLSPRDASDKSLSFFVSSQANTGNLGGLAGADAICTQLATASGSTGKTWHAYLSAENDGTGKPVNAKDRIGNGPWVNAKGVTVAADLAALSAMKDGNADVLLNEKGEKNPGQWAGSPTPVQHDIMTGSTLDGTLAAGTTCADWTSDSADIAGPTVGHSDGMGPMMNTAAPYNSWNSAHTAPNCSATGLAMVGGAGRIYCFAQ